MVIKMKKKKVFKQLKSLDLNIFDGTLDEVIKRLEDFKTKYKENYDEISIFAEQQWDSVYISLMGSRLETDEEFNQRTKKDKIRENKIKQKELIELARLKRKYGDQ